MHSFTGFSKGATCAMYFAYLSLKYLMGCSSWEYILWLSSTFKLEGNCDRSLVLSFMSIEWS